MRTALGIAAALLLAGCAAPGPPPAPGTVTGTVVISPCRPVERVGDPPCPPRAGVPVSFQPAAGGAPTTVTTDAAGSYSVQLAPGAYDARPGGGIGTQPARRITVASGQTVTIDFSVDSGIR